MSVFNKVCPECAAVTGAEATSCACGYSFEDNERSYSRISDEMIADEEALYEEYLAARAKQAVGAVKSAKYQVSPYPSVSNNTDAVTRAKIEAKIAMADLDAQRVRTVVANKIAAKDRHKRIKTEKAKNRLAKIARKRKENANTKAEKARIAKTAAEKARKAILAAEAAKAKKAKTAAEAEIARKKAKTAEKAKKAKAAAEKAKKQTIAAFKSARARNTKQTILARKAKKQSSQKATAKPVRKTSTHTPNSAKATATFRSTQAARIEKLSRYKECPNCTANVVKDVGRCNCGFIFPKGASNLPALTLNADEIRELRSSNRH